LYNSTPIGIDQNCASDLEVNQDLLVISCPSYNNGSGIITILDSNQFITLGKIIGNSSMSGVGQSA